MNSFSFNLGSFISGSRFVSRRFVVRMMIEIGFPWRSPLNDIYDA